MFRLISIALIFGSIVQYSLSMPTTNPETENNSIAINVPVNQDGQPFHIDLRNSKQATINIDDIHSSKKVLISINVCIDTVVYLKLAGNPTTGYSQRVVTLPEDSVVKIVESRYIPEEHEEGVVGFGGIYFFKFLSISPGKTNVQINYARYFESPPNPICETLIEFIVDPQTKPVEHTTVPELQKQ